MMMIICIVYIYIYIYIYRERERYDSVCDRTVLAASDPQMKPRETHMFSICWGVRPKWSLIFKRPNFLESGVPEFPHQ